MSEIDQAIRDVVIANRILAREGIVDAWGHVSQRHPRDPGRYLLSWSRSPELVEPADILEFTLDGKAIGGDGRPPYLERFIHGAIYETRPEVQAVVHAHAEDVLPFGITASPFRAVIHSASDLGAAAPVWDIAERFGAETNLLVTRMEQGRDLARALQLHSAVLMRGHGFAAASPSLFGAVRLAIAIPRNARVLLAAARLGEVTPLSDGEIATRRGFRPQSPEMYRAWEYWAKRAGVSELLGPRPEATAGTTG